MTRVVLVRHAMPVVDPDRPPDRWELSPAGRAAAELLRGRLPADAVPVSSPQAKALDTLAVALDLPADRIRTDPRLAEVARPGEPVDDDVLHRRLAWVTGHPDHRHTTWETTTAAAARFSTALAELDADQVVVGTHGLVSTAWLVSIGQLAAGEAAGAFWQQLGLPDVIEVQLG